MTKSKPVSLEHLQWLVKSRSENQQIALVLYELLKKYDKQWEKKKYSLAAQALVGVTAGFLRYGATPNNA